MSKGEGSRTEPRLSVRDDGLAHLCVWGSCGGWRGAVTGDARLGRHSGLNRCSADGLALPPLTAASSLGPPQHTWLQGAVSARGLEGAAAPLQGGEQGPETDPPEQEVATPGLAPRFPGRPQHLPSRRKVGSARVQPETGQPGRDSLTKTLPSSCGRRQDGTVPALTWQTGPSRTPHAHRTGGRGSVPQVTGEAVRLTQGRARVQHGAGTETQATCSPRDLPWTCLSSLLGGQDQD